MSFWEEALYSFWVGTQQRDRIGTVQIYSLDFRNDLTSKHMGGASHESPLCGKSDISGIHLYYYQELLQQEKKNNPTNIRSSVMSNFSRDYKSYIANI